MTFHLKLISVLFPGVFFLLPLKKVSPGRTRVVPCQTIKPGVIWMVIFMPIGVWILMTIQVGVGGWTESEKKYLDK